jgi:translation initiation factor 2B subunit (eIF-2B alpha/beta/delta family)
VGIPEEIEELHKAVDDIADGKMAQLWQTVHEQGKEIVEMRQHMAVMDERVGTLVKFVDRLVNAVYAAAGSIFLASIAVLVFQRGVI